MNERPDFLHDFPGWLNATLDAACWMRADLSRASCIGKGHISNIMNGKANPTLTTIVKIVDALNERLAEL